MADNKDPELSPETLASVKIGMAQAAAGDLHDLGSFAQYAQGTVKIELNAMEAMLIKNAMNTCLEGDKEESRCEVLRKVRDICSGPVEVDEPTEEHPAVDKARELYTLSSDDNIEIDDNPAISEGEDGTWVQAWVFVANPDPNCED